MQLSKRIIYLRPGEERQITIGTPEPRHTSQFVIRPHELLIVLCSSPGERFSFACGFPKRVRLVTVRKNHLIQIHCKEAQD
jgi:hypothetical protein